MAYQAIVESPSPTPPRSLSGHATITILWRAGPDHARVVWPRDELERRGQPRAVPRLEPVHGLDVRGGAVD